MATLQWMIIPWWYMPYPNDKLSHLTYSLYSAKQNQQCYDKQRSSYNESPDTNMTHSFLRKFFIIIDTGKHWSPGQGPCAT